MVSETLQIIVLIGVLAVTILALRSRSKPSIELEIEEAKQAHLHENIKS